MPPTGTSHLPVPLPITWYRKQRFWRSSGSSAGANVPIVASVSTTPRTRSDENVDSSVADSGSSNNSRHTASLSTSLRISSRGRSGSVRVANSRGATPAIAA